MAVSNSYDFNMTRDDFITEALELLDALPTGGVPSSSELTSASRTLNILVKGLQTRGANLWVREWVITPLVASTVVQGSDGRNYMATREHVSAADTQPVSGANWASYWKVTEQAPTTTWSSGQTYTYIGHVANFDSKYIDLEEAFIRDPLNGDVTDYKMRIGSWGEYLGLPQKVTRGYGIPTSIHVDKQRDNMNFFLYPTPETGMQLHTQVKRSIFDFDAASDDADCPSRWYETLVNGLAYKLAPKYGIWGTKLEQLKIAFESALDEAKRDDKETTSSFIEPAYGETC